MSHYLKLRCRAFDISSLKPNFLCLFISQYQKGDFIIKHEQFIQTTNLFFHQSHIAINLLTCLPWWPSHSHDIYHIKATSVSDILHFPERQLYCQYVVENPFVLDILNVYPTSVCNILHLTSMHLSCQTRAYIFNLSFIFSNLVLFLPFRFTWHAPIISIIH